MGDIYIRRELPYPPGLNTGFVTGCARLAVDSIVNKLRSSDLDEFGFVLWELSISLVDDSEIRDINNRFRNIDEPTDVLSFPQNEPEEIKEFLETAVPIAKLVLGDVVISLEWVARKAENDSEVGRRLFAWMMIHGILHLFGFDHDSAKMETLMRKEEDRILLELEDFISGVAKPV